MHETKTEWRKALGLVLNVVPIPAARPRVEWHGARIPKRQKAAQNQMGILINIGAKRTVIEGQLPLMLKANFIHPRPKALSKKRPGRQWKAKRPDLDNLTKLLMDSIVDARIGVGDDGRFTRLEISDFYSAIGELPKIEFEIWEGHYESA